MRATSPQLDYCSRSAAHQRLAQRLVVRRENGVKPNHLTCESALLWGWWHAPERRAYTPASPVTVIVMPVSSATSRSAAADADSPTSMRPPGSFQYPSSARRTSRTARGHCGRSRTRPVKVRGLEVLRHRGSTPSAPCARSLAEQNLPHKKLLTNLQLNTSSTLWGRREWAVCLDVGAQPGEINPRRAIPNDRIGLVVQWPYQCPWG